MNHPATIETCPAVQRADAIDFSRWFMPQELTPLFHTAIYSSLDHRQRLRYNQLNALYFNEQTMFFEKSLARNVLGYFLAQSLPEKLKADLARFLAEEEQHSAMFSNLNRKCAPAIYAGRDFYFIQMPPAATRALGWISKRPRWFPMLIWLMHLQEERALDFGQAFLKSSDEIEIHFQNVQRRHLMDEMGHVRCDETLLEWVWPETGRLLRQFNARLLAWMINEYFCTPKRAAIRVVTALAEEFPSLQPELPELRRQLVALRHNTEYRRSLYSPENIPRTLKRFDAWPEFASLTKAMPGYAPQMRWS
jgi:P-aminobenzoate N-oxygenase AurF